ncbi:MAG: hypothetical protein ACQER9_04230 [Nanobdellota archaeon]
MVIKNKSQAALEFAVLLGVVLIFFVSITAFLSYQKNVLKEEKTFERMENVMEKVSEEILIAQRVNGNYNRTFVLPDQIIDYDYDIELFRGQEIIIKNEIGMEEFKNLPYYIYGQINEGKNIIRKKGNSIGICWDNCSDDDLFNYSTHIQCMDENLYWGNCQFEYGNKLYGLRVDIQGVDVEMKVTNINDSKTFFHETSSSGSSFTEFIIKDYKDNGYITLNESGYWDVAVKNSTYPWRNHSYYIPYGKFFLEPLQISGCEEDYNTFNCEKYKNFTIKSTVKCIGGECGDVSQWLDPK